MATTIIAVLDRKPYGMNSPGDGALTSSRAPCCRSRRKRKRDPLGSSRIPRNSHLRGEGTSRGLYYLYDADLVRFNSRQGRGVDSSELVFVFHYNIIHCFAYTGWLFSMRCCLLKTSSGNGGLVSPPVLCSCRSTSTT